MILGGFIKHTMYQYNATKICINELIVPLFGLFLKCQTLIKADFHGGERFCMLKNYDNKIYQINHRSCRTRSQKVRTEKQQVTVLIHITI